MCLWTCLVDALWLGGVPAVGEEGVEQPTEAPLQTLRAGVLICRFIIWHREISNRGFLGSPEMDPRLTDCIDLYDAVVDILILCGPA